MVLLVLKALRHLEIFVKPISKHLPEAIGHAAIVLSGALCNGPIVGDGFVSGMP
jgi:hypothetical protein